MAYRTLLAELEENGAYTLSERRDPSARTPRPIATTLSRHAIFGFVDFGVHDALVISEGREITYLVIPFSIPTADSLSATGGTCVAIRPEAGLSEEYLRGWAHAMKECLVDAIEVGMLTERAAAIYFESQVRAFSDTTEVIVP